MMVKRILKSAICVMLVLGMSTAVFAATTNFSTTLPQYQQDREVSTVRRGTESDSFKIHISSINGGTDKVCVWTEKPGGGNYSNPYEQVGVQAKYIKYSSLPKVGDNVVLNMDNPVYTSTLVTVSGSWDPQ